VWTEFYKYFSDICAQKKTAGGRVKNLRADEIDRAGGVIRLHSERSKTGRSGLTTMS
jgi:hypothetical protein